MKSIISIICLLVFSSCQIMLNSISIEKNKTENVSYKEINNKTVLNVFESKDIVVIIFTDGTTFSFNPKKKTTKIE